MAIFTSLTREDVSAYLDHYGLGTLVDLNGISSGIENTNYFLDTSSGRFVLTLFERLTAAELPFYLQLMQHLARRWLPVPEPAETRSGSLQGELRGKPAAIVTRMPGHAVLDPLPAHCAAVGAFLAKMHLEAQDFKLMQPHMRGLGWWKHVLPTLQAHVPSATFQRLTEEVIFQDSFAHGALFDRLPVGPIHADLFRDNVLFDETVAPRSVVASGDTGAQSPKPTATADLQPAHRARIGGVIDFYFAGCSVWLFDVAVAMNDWCVDLFTGEFDALRTRAFLQGYHGIRPLSDDEHLAWPAVLRAAALRFWISRLHDLHQPRPAHVLTPHDPGRFERMLALRIDTQVAPWL